MLQGLPAKRPTRRAAPTAAERHRAVHARWRDRPDDIAGGMPTQARAAVKSARGIAGQSGGRGPS